MSDDLKEHFLGSEFDRYMLERLSPAGMFGMVRGAVRDPSSTRASLNVLQNPVSRHVVALAILQREAKSMHSSIVGVVNVGVAHADHHTLAEHCCRAMHEQGC